MTSKKKEDRRAVNARLEAIWQEQVRSDIGKPPDHLGFAFAVILFCAALMTALIFNMIWVFVHQ